MRDAVEAVPRESQRLSLTANPIAAILATTPGRLDLLRHVRDLRLPDAWIAAGAVRNAVWDHVHGFIQPTTLNDVDVIWFDPSDASAERDAALEAILRERCPDQVWQVRNQARMHIRNGDPPYRDCLHAMRHWLEIPTAVAARLSLDNRIEVITAFGPDDLLNLTLRPTPAGLHKLAVFQTRVETHGWLRTWPLVRVLIPDAAARTTPSA